MAGQIPATTAGYFQEVDRIARSMNYQYAEACRIAGESATHEDVKNLLLRLSSSLGTGEKEADFMLTEANVQAEAYGNIYERKLETLKKWTDAFSALIVSAALIIVVASVSTMIYDLGSTVVGGLVFGMVGISALGAWIVYRASPREVKAIRGPSGERSQVLPQKLFIYLFPGALVTGALLWMLNADIGIILVLIGVMFLPIGITARRLDRRIEKQDAEISTFLRALGTTVSAIGTTPVVAMGRMDLRSLPALRGSIERLRVRLLSRVAPVGSWTRFVEETGSEVISRSVRVFLDGLGLGGDAEEIGKRASVLSLKVHYLRAKRKLVSSSFFWLTLAMHITITFLLIFIVEIVNGFNGLLENAGSLDIGSGGSASLGSVLAFNVENMEFLRTMMVPVVIVLSVVNAVAPKVADGGYGHTLFYYLGITTMASGVVVMTAPIVAGMIFGVTEAVS